MLSDKAYFKALRARRKYAGLCMSCGRHPTPCPQCREYMRKWRAGIPRERKAAEWISKRDYFLFHKFGIRLKEYEAMYAAQNGCCAICHSQTTGDVRLNNFVIDHCHRTGKVRGLLCASCNKAIGFFEDSIVTLQRAIAYLQHHTVEPGNEPSL